MLGKRIALVDAVDVEHARAIRKRRTLCRTSCGHCDAGIGILYIRVVLLVIAEHFAWVIQCTGPLREGRNGVVHMRTGT